jgi:hypothetical protein
MKFHHVYFANFFTSPFLVEQLLVDSIYCTGTLKATRTGIPTEIIRDMKMNCGDVKFLAINSISVVLSSNDSGLQLQEDHTCSD